MAVDDDGMGCRYAGHFPELAPTPRPWGIELPERRPLDPSRPMPSGKILNVKPRRKKGEKTMLTLRFDPRVGASPNSFSAVHVDGAIYSFTAFIRTTDAAPIVLVRFFGQIQTRESRGKDPEGKPVLLVSRSSEDEHSVETARLHHDLPMMALRLIGWRP